MAQFYWDASGLIKRYFAEVGSDTADALFDLVPRYDMITSPIGYTETYSLLVRRLNERVIDLPTFRVAITSLQNETVNDRDFGFLPISDQTIFGSIAAIAKHNLNATDAAILTMLLAYISQPSSPLVVLVAGDKRLLRAANSEGIANVNPQLMKGTDVPAFLSSL